MRRTTAEDRARGMERRVYATLRADGRTFGAVTEASAWPSVWTAEDAKPANPRLVDVTALVQPGQDLRDLAFWTVEDGVVTARARPTPEDIPARVPAWAIELQRSIDAITPPGRTA